jgi:hypothetical protein
MGRASSDVVFKIALLSAILKDVLEWFALLTVVGTIPVIGSIVTFFIEVWITVFLYQHGWFRGGKVRRKIGKWVIGLVLENFPFLEILSNIAPITTINVLWAWHDIKKEAKKAQVDVDTLKRDELRRKREEHEAARQEAQAAREEREGQLAA